MDLNHFQNKRLITKLNLDILTTVIFVCVVMKVINFELYCMVRSKKFPFTNTTMSARRTERSSTVHWLATVKLLRRGVS